jgi:predicted transcriptional regulator YheO
MCLFSQKLGNSVGFMNVLTQIIPLCDAMVRLMHPLVEIAIHDLSSETVAYIAGNLSKRKVGDPSLFSSDVIEEGLDRIIYPKVNFDGRLVKAISIPINGKWLVCINADISIFSHIKTLSEHLLSTTEPNHSGERVENKWRENLHAVLYGFLQKQKWNFDTLTHSQKKELAHHFFKCGAFSEKGAAEYIAKILFISRATVFKYLKEWRHP